MPSQKTLELARHYLQKHAVSEEIFGLGHSLDTASFMLYASKTVPNDGSLNLVIDGEYWDCRTLSEKIYDDILDRNPELKPKIMTFRDKGVHNWVEMIDPETKATVQIDATPWYNCLDIGHSGKDTSAERIDHLMMSANGGIPFAVTHDQNECMSTYLHGCLPNITYSKGRMISMVNPELQPKPDRVKYPDYLFIMQTILADHFSDEPTNSSSVYVSIMDAQQMQEAATEALSIGDLVSSKTLELGILLPAGDGSLNRHRVCMISELSELAEILQSKTLKEAARNIERTMPLLRQVSPVLQVCGEFYSHIDVRTGQTLQYEELLQRSLLRIKKKTAKIYPLEIIIPKYKIVMNQ
jgi:hypothetical protein